MQLTKMCPCDTQLASFNFWLDMKNWHEFLKPIVYQINTNRIRFHPNLSNLFSLLDTNNPRGYEKCNLGVQCWKAQY